MAHAGVAWRRDLPVLTFGFLIHRDGERWEGRSVLTSHVATGDTAEDAIRNLTAVIDAALLAAEQAGLSPEEWHNRQVADEPQYVLMYCEIVSKHDPERTKSELSGGAVLSVSVARAA